MNYRFLVNNKKDKKVLIMWLVGYKPDLWDKVFNRFIKYINIDADICLVSSGLSNDKLISLAKTNNWSYMTTTENNLCLAQNECIAYHKNAEYIFKIDEDIFVTKNSFSNLFEEFKLLETSSNYVPGAIVPMININANCLPDLLKLTCHYNSYYNRFGRPYVSDGRTHHNDITFNAEISKWIWSNIDIDDDNIIHNNISMCLNDDVIDTTYKRVSIIGTRFSIGMILFKRDVWENMGMFPYTPNDELEYKRIGLGEDEKALCTYCMLKARPIFMLNNTLVGHLSYGPTTDEMMSFFFEHQELF